jgi:multimeric flavodoxin WrbA
MKSRNKSGGDYMKVVAFNGSARKNGNTAILVKTIFKELEKEGIATELIQMAGSKIRGCTACYKCSELKNKQCSIKNDSMNDYIKKMCEADGIILASPTYFSDVTSEMKALIDRSGMVAKRNDDMFSRKIGAAVVAVRRGGAIHAFDSMNHFFFINQMIVPGANYWNVGIGREIGEVEKDEEGMMNMKVLGENMAWLLKKILT